MSLISFDSLKLRQLAKLSIDNPDARRFNMTQAWSVEFLRDDLPSERLAYIMADAEEGISTRISAEDLDRSKVPAGVWLVADGGIGIISNVDVSRPGVLSEPTEVMLHAFDTDPRCFDLDERDMIKVDVFGGDDEVNFIDAEFIMAATEQLSPVVFYVDEDHFRVATAYEARVYIQEMLAIDPLFFEPDTKGPPVLYFPGQADEPDLS